MTVKPRIFRSRMWYFLISAQNIDYGYEYPQTMFQSRIKNNNVYTPVIPSFTIIKLGFVRVNVMKTTTQIYHLIYPFKPNGFFHPYHFDEYILQFRGGMLILS